MREPSFSKMLGLEFFSFLVLGMFQVPVLAANPDFLWKVVSLECVPNQKNNNSPVPCVEVSFQKDGERGYAVFKDRNGPLQYLLLPTTKIMGIEDPEVLTDKGPNYFYQAWEARSHLEKMYRSSIAPEEISLTLNSLFGRSQNQLHIHISCTRPDVKTLIHTNLDQIGFVWSEFPKEIFGHKYFSRRITVQQLKEENAFQLLAKDLPEAKANMQAFGLAVVAIKNAMDKVEFVMLANRADLSKTDKGHVEEIQDHQCPQLFGK